jgi:DNA-binding transcriptional ArsR family regulator
MLVGVTLSLLSTHGRVLAAISRGPRSRVRDLADQVGLTERAVQGAIGDLVREGYLERVREGRRNRYVIRRDDRPGWGPMPGSGRESQDPRQAVVLACSDHRIQGGLQRFVTDRGLAGRAEMLLWPGGGPALAGPHRGELFEALRGVLERGGARSLILVSHSGCEVPDVSTVAGASPAATYRSVRRWARRISEQCRRRLGMEPELWLLHDGRPAHVRVEATRGQAEEGASRRRGQMAQGRGT